MKMEKRRINMPISLKKSFITISTFRHDESVVPQMRADTQYKKELCRSVKEKIGMDSFSKPIFNQLVEYFLENNKLRDAMFLICMANWGTRFGDAVRVRFCHIFDENGKFKDSFMLNGGEEKTGKMNIYYNNEAVKKIITMYLLENPKEYYDYLFVSESRNKSKISLKDIDVNERFENRLETIEADMKQISEQKSALLKLFSKEIITENEFECELQKLRAKELKLTKELNEVKLRMENYKSNAPDVFIQMPMKRAAAEVFIKSALRDLNIITENRLNKTDSVNFNQKFNTHSLRKFFGDEFRVTGSNLRAMGEIEIDMDMLKLLQDKYMHSSASTTSRYSQVEERNCRTICMNMNLGLDVLEKYC